MMGYIMIGVQEKYVLVNKVDNLKWYALLSLYCELWFIVFGCGDVIDSLYGWAFKKKKWFAAFKLIKTY